MSDSIRKQVLEMYVGVVLHNLVLAAICLVRFRSVPVFLGLLAGMLGAFGLLASIAVSAELCAASGDEAYASKKMAAHALLRGLGIIAAVAVLWKFTDINILAAALGLLGMKTGAYLYPAVHKFLNHRAGDSQAPLG